MLSSQQWPEPTQRNSQPGTALTLRTAGPARECLIGLDYLLAAEIMMRTPTSVICLIFVLTLAARATNPFTFEDMMKLKRVEEPVVSPDGKWVLFAAVDVDLKANTKTPHIWVVALSSNSERSGVAHPNAVLATVGYKSTADPSTLRKDSETNPSASRGMTDGKSIGGGTSAEREIISDQDADRPRWAPDGKHFAFISTQDIGSQVWIADFDDVTGTVTAKYRLTSIATEADGELWSPDGKNVLFKSDVYPECDTAPVSYDCNTRKVQQSKDSKVKAQIFTHLLYRHWNAYKEGKRTHLFVVPYQGIGNVPRDLTPGDYDAPVWSLGGQDDYAFSPDGQEICYASNHDADPAISTNNDLFIVPVNFPASTTSKDIVAATKDITAENKAADDTPLYSPDGKYIAFRAQQRPGNESDRWRLMLYERKTGARENLTEHFDRWVGTMAWTPTSKALYFSSEEAGDTPLFRLGLDSSVTRVMQGTYDDLAFTPDDQTLLLTQMSVRFPNRIVAVDIRGVEERVAKMVAKSPTNPAGRVGEITDVRSSRVADLNEQLLFQISMPSLERFWFTGAHGDTVEGFLLQPPNFDSKKRYPVKFIVHGGPEVPIGDEWTYRWNAELFAANGYVVIEINFHGSPGYGQKFIDAIDGDWGGAPYEDLMKGLDYAEQHYAFIDRDRECALGGSFGGYMVNWILGHTNRFECLVSHDGDFNLEADYGTTEELWFPEWELKGTPWTNREMYRRWSPHLLVTNFKTPTLVIHGQLDYRIDVSEGFDLFTSLERVGVPSKMLYFPEEGHWVLKPQNSQLWYKTVDDWVDQWVRKKGGDSE
jgi:dipeptidyl aminopeptidase/acylaminoacyl peptidase